MAIPGRGQRKIGRSSRKPAHVRYNATNRHAKNKERRRLKNEKRMAYFKKRREAKTVNYEGWEASNG